MRDLRLLPVLAIALALVASRATAQVVVFQNDFSHDTVDAAPSTDPPLEPIDDVFQWARGHGEILVRGTVGDLVSQPLEMIQVPIVGSTYIRAKIGTDHQQCQTYLFSWRSLVRSPSAFFITQDIRGERGALLSSISWRGTKIVFNAGGSNETDLPMGWISDVSQLYEVSLDLQTKTLSVSVDGAPVSTVQNQAFRQFGTQVLSMGFSFGGIGSQRIAIDDIMITATGCSGVAVEAPNWGAVKARFGR